MLFMKVYKEFSNLSEYLSSLGLLSIRLLLVYGFYEPAMQKWYNIKGVSTWFDSIGIPFANLSSYLVAFFETAGVLLLLFGLFTRIITVPLVIIMIIAIFAVHLPNGFSVQDNGFEIPLYYLLFLMILLSHGAGKFSLDNLFMKKKGS